MWSSLLTNTMLQCPEWDCQIKLWQDDVLSSKLSNVIFRGNFIIICHLKWESKNIRKNISARHKKSLCKLFNEKIYTYFNLRKLYQQWKDLRCQDRRKKVEEYNLCWETQWWRWARGWIRFISDNCWSNFIPITTSLLAPGGLLLHLSSTLNKTHWKQWLVLLVLLKNMRFSKVVQLVV